MIVTVRYYAAARAVAGVKTEAIELSSKSTLEQVLAVIRERHGHNFSRVLDGCSFFLNEISASRQATRVEHDSVLDVLPPFAGGRE